MTRFQETVQVWGSQALTVGMIARIFNLRYLTKNGQRIYMDG